MSDEDTVTTLAYSKSPKFSKRTIFQEELQEALFARAARQNSTGYSDDFESDEEGLIKELLEDMESTPKKSLAFTIPLFNNNLGSVGALQSGSADDLASSYGDKRPQQVSMLNSEISSEERQAVPFSLNENSGSYKRSAKNPSVSFEISPSDDYPWERETVDMTLSEDEERTLAIYMLQSKNLSEERQGDDSELSVSEEEFEVGGDQDQQNKAPVTELQMEGNDVPYKPEIKPVPKPREFKTKTASASAENISIPALDEYSKPSPQPRSVLRKRSHLEYYEGSKAEDRASHVQKLFSLSAPSSLTRLNDQVIKSEQRALSESPGPEGPWLASSSSPFPINFSSMDERTGDSKQIMSEEESSRDQEPDNCSDTKFQDSGRESPSVIELMMTTVYEKTKKPNKSPKGYLEGKVQTSERVASEDGSNETAKENKSEQKIVLNTSKEEVEGTAPQKTKPSAGRSLSSTYLKKTGKPSSIPMSTSSQYLGTLKVLDNKHLQKYSAELDKADSLRAAVYQDWLEKKRIFLLELQRIKRNKAESWRDKTAKKEAAKKEQAVASFEAWKAMKEKEAKRVAEKKKLAEEKKRIEAELNERKQEEAQKAFEKWKEKKAEYLKQQVKKEKRVERLKKTKEEEVVAEKRKDSRSAVEKWNEKKEEFMKQKKKEKIQERKKEIEEDVETEEKDKKAIEEYEKWLEKKEMNDKIQKRQKKLQVIFEDEMPPPWSPPGKAVFSGSY